MKFSASKASLLRSCQFPFREGTPCVDERGRSAINGDRFHKAIAKYIQTGVRPVETGRRLKWLEDRLDHATAWVDERKAPWWEVEVAYAYAWRTGESRILGYDIGREYAAAGLREDEIAGSADLTWMSGDTVTVVDHKTGRSISEAAWAQLGVLAVMAAKAHGAWHARVVIWHVTDYGIVEYERDLDDVAIWAIAEQLREDLAEVPDAWPTPGPHCDAMYCSARASCDLYQLHRKGAA